MKSPERKKVPKAATSGGPGKLLLRINTSE
jgi:hypothetical protein